MKSGKIKRKWQFSAVGAIHSPTRDGRFLLNGDPGRAHTYGGEQRD